MNEHAAELRKQVISAPELILEDADVMQALIRANETHSKRNVVDLRGIAMGRLETRLEQLETTHQTVIAAAYENLAGAKLIQTAVLQLIEPAEFDTFLAILSHVMPETLRVSRARLVIESREHLEIGFEDVLSIVEPGVVDYYITAGRNIAPKPVTLRQIDPASEDVYGKQAGQIKSECLLRLDLGAGRLPALLILGSDDPDQFQKGQGGDLLAFFAAAFERVLRRWLA